MPKRYRKLRGGYRLLPLCSPHGLRAPAPPCGCCALRPGGAGPGRRAAGAADGFSAAGSRTPPAAVPTAPAVTALPAPTHVTVQPLAATRDALADTQRAGRKRPRHARDRSSPCRSRSRNSAPVPGTLREKPRPHRLAAHRRDGHRPACRADARRQRILPAPRLLTAFTPWAARCFWMSAARSAPTRRRPTG